MAELADGHWGLQFTRPGCMVTLAPAIPARRKTSPDKGMMMVWLVLVLAGIFEVVWAFTMKLSEGFTRLWPTVITFIAMAISFALLSWSMRVLPLGTAYMVWTGIGAVGAFAVGVLVLGEPASPMRVIAAALIVAGLALMKLGTPA